jgi:transposase
MPRGRTTFSSDFKAEVALEAIKGRKSVNQLAKEYHIPSNLISCWERKALKGIKEIFNSKRSSETKANTEQIEKFFKKMSKQQIKLD